MTCEYHLCVWANESGILCAGGDRPNAVHWLSGGETQRLAAAQGGGGQTPFTSSTAVVGDAERTALVVVQTTSCRGWYGPEKQQRVQQMSRAGERRRQSMFGKCYRSLLQQMHWPQQRVFSYSYYFSPSHLSPCLTRPNSISPQWSQKAGARYECTLRAWGRIWKSSNVAAAKRDNRNKLW